MEGFSGTAFTSLHYDFWNAGMTRKVRSAKFDNYLHETNA